MQEVLEATEVVEKWKMLEATEKWKVLEATEVVEKWKMLEATEKWKVPDGINV